MINTADLSKIAILLPGHLRCLESSYPYIKAWSKNAALFVVTNRDYEREAGCLADLGAHCRFVEDSPDLANLEAAIPVSQLVQWSKLRACIDMVWDVERDLRHRYEYVIKIRTDYVFSAPDVLLDMEREATNHCIFADTDMCFSGRREFVLPLHGLYMAGLTTFYKRTHHYFPINPDHILESDPTSCKWYWAGFPAHLVDMSTFHPVIPSMELLRSVRENRDKILNYVHESTTKLVPYAGRPDFPSERVFFNYLNFLGIPIKSHEKFSGYIRHTRFWSTQPKDTRHFFQEVLPERLRRYQGSFEKNGAIAFHVTGDLGGQWLVNFHDGRASVSAGGGDAICAVTIRNADFMDLLLRSRSLSLHDHRIEATGDLSFLRRFGKLLFALPK